ncbi:hypothetical protein ASC87_27135 [Rhizobacter sp. Root1221]|nr:hypothetical protein ASC87_27135 [Rhizobacter sp. Root1221]
MLFDMNLTDPRSQAAFDAAINHMRTTTAAVADRVATHLGILASGAQRVFERDLLINAQLDLRRNMSNYVLTLGDTLSKRVAREVSPQHEPSRKLAETDWQSLSLVNDDEVEERMFADRISQAIALGCEWELRDLAAFTGAMLGIGRADHDRNPLRPEVLGAAVYRAICSITNDIESRKVLARELGAALSKVMPECYRDIAGDFRARGIQPVSLSVRGVEGPGNDFGRDRVISGYDTLRHDTGSSTRAGGFDTTTTASEFDGALPHHSGPGGHPTGSGRTASGAWGSSGSGRGPGQAGAGRFTPRPGVSPQADAELMTLIRRLTFLASRPAELSDLGGLGHGGGATTGSGAGLGGASAPMPFSASRPGQPAMMAVNMIRAHRDELRQASTGTLDHMVIDVVGSLFDQILSDPRVPPQMARQIARLQLPVLRVALSDQTFFSSRKHPVRRFVNRIASLALAFEEFDSGPGQQFLARVRELVQEIVEGDFDQMEVYTAKVASLENFIAQQAKEDVSQASEAVSVVNNKESDLRVQQRYMLQLQTALAPLALQDYLRDFLSQVWSQALALGTRKEGPQSEIVQRLRRAGRDLVMSVQPKGSPALRKKFLMQLPPLMKDLNEGLRLIGWPEAAQKEFFSRLLPAHAESLKGQPMTELEYNLLAKQLEGVFNTPVPETDALLRDVPMTSTGASPIEPQFTPEEAKRIGLVEENAVNWAGEIDIDLSAGPEAEPVSSDQSTTPGELDLDLSAVGLDINLDAPPDPSEPPTQGAHLIDHVRLGFAYQMNLNDEWQKVRLSYVSPGRAFFVFTRGKRHTETVSLTSRMLSRMCETGRFRAFESAYLMERATARARKQLAALSKGKGDKGATDRAPLGKR